MSLLEALERAAQLLEAIARGEFCCLRHGLPYVTPSLLASQAFCEARLDYRLSRGEEEGSPSPNAARAVLQAVLGARRRLRSGDEEKGVVLDTPLAAVVYRIPLVGRPHALAVKGGCVKAVYVAKKGRRVYTSDRVKANAYASMVKELGMACGTMRIAYLLAESPNEAARLLMSLDDPFNPRPQAGGDSTRLVVEVYDEAEAERLLAPLAAYWLGLRDPSPRPGRWCSQCPYRGICPAAAGYSSSDST